MKHYSPRPAPRPRTRPLAIPAFHPVPGKARQDGWTARRQAEFIGYLAETRSVSLAARFVGMARESAYRLRSRPWSEGFCAAWHAALGQKSQAGATLTAKVTSAELRWRVEIGLWQVCFEEGRFVGLWHEPDNCALLQLLARQRLTRRSATAAAALP